MLEFLPCGSMRALAVWLTRELREAGECCGPDAEEEGEFTTPIVE